MGKNPSGTRKSSVGYASAFGILTNSATQPLDGVLLGSCLWLLVAAIAFGGQLASDRHYGAFAIDAGYHFAILNFMIVLLTIWR